MNGGNKTKNIIINSVRANLTCNTSADFSERASERVHFDQASAILDSNSGGAWGERKNRQKKASCRLRLQGQIHEQHFSALAHQKRLYDS